MESPLVSLSAFAGQLISDNSEIPTDITFKFVEAGGGDTEVSAHKMILAMVSQPFRHLFFANNTMDNVMVIEDTTRPTFQMMIDAIYNVKSMKESLQGKTVDEMFAVLYIVTKYKISTLEVAVKEALSTFAFTEDNVIKAANEAMEYTATFDEAVQELLLAGAKFLQSNFSDDDSYIIFLVKNSDQMSTVHKLTLLMLDLPPTSSPSPTTCWCYWCKKDQWEHYFF